ncbi:hypothetical protein ACQKCU_15070 [Heyndrickxia sporothermodurans]
MQIFEINKDEMESIFNMASRTILVNDVERKAIITNPQFSQNEERFINTLDVVTQGDIVKIDEYYYLVVSENITKRHSKYKAKIRHCSYIIRIPGEITSEPMLDEDGNQVYDSQGRPVFIEIEGEPYFIPAIVDKNKFNIVGGQILVADDQVIITVQDNELNTDKFAVNKEFDSMNKKWKVRNQDRTKRGLLILTCERKV